MGLFVRLPRLESYTDDRLEEALAVAPARSMLRDALADVIAAIHGLKYVTGVPLSKLLVYIGRAGSTATHLRKRWKIRFGHDLFARAPSTHAVVALRASTTLVREGNWERLSQRVINYLARHGALCCANAVTGDCGEWPDTPECAIYVVARIRKGPAGSDTPEVALTGAMKDLLDDDELDAHVVREVGRMILDSSRATGHEELSCEEDNEKHLAGHGREVVPSHVQARRLEVAPPTVGCESITCPKCAASVQKDRFCVQCGTPLAGIQNHVVVGLEKREDGMYLGQFEDRTVPRTHNFFLEAKGADEGVLRMRLPRLLKIGSWTQIGNILNAALPGVQVGVEYRPPGSILVNPGVVYFRINQTGDCWKDILDSGTIAIFQPIDPPKTVLRLIAIRVPN